MLKRLIATFIYSFLSPSLVIMVTFRGEGLTYDDVLIVPKRSRVNSRKDISLRTKLTNNIFLNIPVVSANMDTVTESKMAIAMAKAGGIGFIHRFLTIQEQVKEVIKVKRFENIVVENPYTLPKFITVEEAKEFLKDYNISSILVADSNNYIEGIVTNRDFMFAQKTQKLSEIMTPKSRLITSNVGISIEEAKKILYENRLEKLPLINNEGVIKGLITSKDILEIQKFPYACKDEKGRLRVGAAIGVKENDIERAKELVKAGADVIVVDIAHGHSDLAINMIQKLKKEFLQIEVVAGNVATPEGVEDLINAGADCVKVGVGPGALCTTRIVTGSGYPQLSALIECAKVAKKYNIPLNADGGIRSSGDIAKALATGAQTVMIGSMLSGTEESPGDFIVKNGIKYKIYRGMASLNAATDRRKIDSKDKININDIVPEGVETMVPYKGSAQDLLKQLIGGLLSGISYGGSSNIEEFQEKAEFVRITDAGMKESKPHGERD